ncbi:MAG: hypothetical protein ACK5NT_10200 [Pyrinomonadaceae bacterium]
MAITKKKRRKSRIPTAVEVPAEGEEKDVQYKDEFQTTLGDKIESVGKKFEGQGRNLIYGLVAVVLIGLAIGLFYLWKKRANNEAQTALGTAIETSQATVSEAPVPQALEQQTFKTEKARAEAAIKQFKYVADNYGSPYKEKANYFIAVNNLLIDRNAAMKELGQIATGSDSNALLAKFAMAQEYTSEAKYDDAVKLYKELAASSDPVLSKNTINFDLAEVYEKQGKTKEAADIYFNIANEAAGMKDKDGKPLLPSPTAREAKQRLEKLDPARAKTIKEPELGTDEK